ncbi:anti-sigma factor [Saccharopolyspora spinosa]|uniref:Regulator of SigK n=1 Tax=Saccharopolyspora spinosa TaxID=60894 RepID=A0A2N3XV91_SACSN|nr:anti-sigma factor [Saccharopolyspora spinosa]PKW14593.1 anti-sigma-K factor RskA [Saccharopolyspora spinosa]
MNTDMATLTGAYAADALPDDERSEFERHLGTCADCATEVRELRETLARLSATSATRPPDGLKQRVLDEIRTTRQQPPATHDRPRIAAARPSWTTRLAVAAVVLGIATAGGLGAVTIRTQNQLDDTRRELTAGSERSAEIAGVLAAPDARILSAGGSGVNATTVMSKELGKTVFMGSATTAPPPDRVYQLWFIGDYGYISAGVMRESGSGRMDPIVAPVPAGTAGMGVTTEPAGGSPQPTTAPVLQMTIPA